VFVFDLNLLLALERNATRIPLEAERALVDFLAEPWTEYSVYCEALRPSPV